MAEIKDIIASDLEHIPRGDAAQNKLRQYFQYARMRSLGKGANGTKEDALREAIAQSQAEVPGFTPQYDRSYFEQDPDISAEGNDLAVQDAVITNPS